MSTTNNGFMAMPRGLDRGLIASLAAGELLVLLASWAGQLPGDRPGTMALLGLAAGLWLYLIVRTVRRMARWREELPSMTYRLGVVGFGLMFWVWQSIAEAVQHAGGMSHLFSATFAWYLLFYAAIEFPISIWAGYGFGWAMFGIDPVVTRRSQPAPDEGS